MTPALEAWGRMTWARQYANNFPLTPVEHRFIDSHYPGGVFGFERDRNTVLSAMLNKPMEIIAPFLASLGIVPGNVDPKPYTGDDRQRYATGGYVKPGPLYLVGERGAEFVTPAKGRTE